MILIRNTLAALPMLGVAILAVIVLNGRQREETLPRAAAPAAIPAPVVPPAQPPPRAEAARPPAPAKPANGNAPLPGLGDAQDFGGLREQLASIRQQSLDALRLHQERMKRLQQRGRQLGRSAQPPSAKGEHPADAAPTWLGARLAPPERALAEQLDLPKGQGLVVLEAGAATPAAKAGLKTSDVLLELAERPVPNKFDEFANLLRALGPRDAVDVAVMRKGVKQTLRGVRLTGEAPPAPRRAGARPQVPVNPAIRVQQLRDAVTIQHDGITILCRLSDALTVRSILIREGRDTRTYDRLDLVPPRYRDRVGEMIAQGELRARRG